MRGAGGESLPSALRLGNRYGAFPSSRAGGFTLIEILVASALFVVLGLTVVALFHWGLQGYAQGKLNTSAQQAARDLSDKLKNELSTAARLNTLPTNNPPPVLLPSASGPLTTVENGVTLACTYNDVLFVAAALPADQMDPTNPNDFRFVRYTAVAPNKVGRIEYPVTAGDPPAPFLSTNGVAWTVDVNKLNSTPGAEKDVEDLEGANDFFGFWIIHAMPPDATTNRVYQVQVEVDRFLYDDTTRPPAGGVRDSLTGSSDSHWQDPNKRDRGVVIKGSITLPDLMQ